MIETRKSEIRYRTSDPARMLGRYTTRQVLKEWEEEFVDPDTNERSTIKRHNLLLDKGVYINNDVLAEIKFWIEEGSISEIEVSNQRRMSYEYENTRMFPYKAMVKIDDKKQSFLLYATSVKNAVDIITDYVELNCVGGFYITDLKELDYSCILVDKLKSVRQRNIELEVAYLNDEISIEEYMDSKIDDADPDKSGDDDEEDPLKLKFYQIGAHIVQRLEDVEDEVYDTTFIVRTFSAVRANLIINKYLNDQQEKRYQESLKHEDRTFVKKEILSFIEESKILSIGSFIPRQFSEVYYKDEER